VTLADGLLNGARTAIAGGAHGAGGPGDRGDVPGESALSARLRALGAVVDELGADILADEDSAAGWARDHAPLDALVYDAGPAFGAGGADALRSTMDEAWRAIRAVATGALIESARPGRVLLLAPRPDAGPHAAAARAALENLARTLSVEWARHSITAVALWPGAQTTDAEVAELACFLLSPAGGYFSGCRFELGAAPVAVR
jgi:NAD(P)-dependent dehydrogenase (short-subunit alcohol dehydrogenase family)